jgi:CRISPR-associated protein Csm3
MTLKLHGRVFIKGNIRVKTGLHIGGSGGAFAIGGVDNPVIIDQLTRQPYIPGSSLRGKMRSLTEKSLGQVTGQSIGQNVEIHACLTQIDFDNCPICNLYGISARGIDSKNRINNLPTRLIVRDVPLTEPSVRELDKARTALPYTEVKTEVAIDRVTSQATPRDIQRVPAGAVFGPMELVYNIYSQQDIEWFKYLLEAMDLLQDDYLGGYGSRGSGKIIFQELSLSLKLAENYVEELPFSEEPAPGLSNLIADLPQIKHDLLYHIFGTG